MRLWRERLETSGYPGLVDRRKARPSDKRVPVEKVEQVLRLNRGEQLRSEHSALSREAEM